ncbi:hypothetical protein DYD21_05730 [Rhodohalobacter sp. SW132]|uniref:hypothetical protein n=1 Tax=Rhodohalobacter sp. SW132 TaxID=2293433 RepID=UPI000E25AA62|nr:hypothetical protein [Rhodohalobacter sp. SW132]REL38113.1 hypothetical protein DYD21_05730 [Rhodohalobacter sp. SW132]
MSTEKKKDLRTYTSDLLALEKHFMNAIKKQKASDKVKDDRVIELMHELDKMVSTHVKSLERHVDRLGGEMKSDIKSKIASFTGSVAGLMDSVRSDTVSKMMRDDYTALSMITIGYTMLHTHALAEEDELLADLTTEHMTRCTSLITEISKVVPLVVASEMIEDEKRAEIIGQKALENTQAAWKPDVVNREPEIV